MLREYKGDLFTSGAPVIGHGVNLDGVMGGLAGLVRQKYPRAAQEYFEAVSFNDLDTGDILPVLTETEKGEPLYVIHMVTQDRPGPSARLEWLDEATQNALHFCREKFYSRLAIPQIGSGIGGLDYETQVRPLFEKIVQHYQDVDLAVYYL